jgi:hypothetical protein
MPPRAVWKIRPSRVVPNLLMWARSSRTSTGGMGMARVSLSGAVLQVQVGLSQHYRLRRAQPRVIEAGEERLQGLSPPPQPPDGVQERLVVDGGSRRPAGQRSHRYRPGISER